MLRTTSYRFLAPCRNLEKTNDTIPRKCPERQIDGQKDRGTDRPYFIGPFRQPLGIQKVCQKGKVFKRRNWCIMGKRYQDCPWRTCIIYQKMYILLIDDKDWDWLISKNCQTIQEVVSLEVSNHNHPVMNKKQANQIELSPKKDCRKRKIDSSLVSPSYCWMDCVINHQFTNSTKKILVCLKMGEKTLELR